MKGRMNGAASTERFVPEVQLLTMTKNPIETLFCIWHGSRYPEVLDVYVLDSILKGYDYEDKHLHEIRESTIKMLVESYPEYAGEEKDPKKVIYSVVDSIVHANFPILEAVQFTFCVDKVTAAWRDQLVRDRRAMYWTQSSRTLDMSTMDVCIPNSVADIGGDKGVKIYKDTVDTIREAYIKLQELGVPGEDIRLAPGSWIQRDYWTIDLRDLLIVFKKRNDWIAQATLWLPIISEVLRVLPEEMSDLLRKFMGKPGADLIRDEDGNLRVSNYLYDSDNEARYLLKDDLLCDPLWLAWKGYDHPKAHKEDYAKVRQYSYLKDLYINIWSDEYLELLGWDRSKPWVNGPYDLVYEPGE